MALVQQANGSQTCVITTEHTLATRTDGKTYVLALDFNASVTGDVFEIRAKTKVLTGSTAREAYLDTISGAQTQPNYYSLPIPAPWSVAFTIKQTAGTGRVVDYSIMSLD